MSMGKGSLAVVGFLLLPKNLTLILLIPPLNSCLPETKCAQKAPLPLYSPQFTKDWGNCLTIQFYPTICQVILVVTSVPPPINSLTLGLRRGLLLGD
ncbi:hypothetical protein CDAR_403711 [Caerostris darwini]|uniref:Secreted protein n=1 Tax=Caerostris darwini TaxID=1538125 RepID=A0AAV4TJ49_9ARAC|nr:hypothetical protein CDAR_403711 [Caerostris darwini]